jgi:hypothetical protein
VCRHFRVPDIVGQLQAKGASSTSDFEWQMQLRYYWEGDDLVVRQVRRRQPKHQPAP